MEIFNNNVQEILARYDRENWEKSVSQLNDIEVLAVHDYMQQNNLHKVTGSVVVDTESMIWGEGFADWPDGLPSINIAVSYNPTLITELQKQDDRILGPYIFDDGTFTPKGIAVWGLKHAVNALPRLNPERTSEN